MDRPVNIWFLFPDTYVAGQVTGWEIIGAIDDDVIIGNQLAGVARGQTRGVGVDCKRRVDCKQTCPRRISLFASDIAGSMQNLPMQIAQIYCVLINYADGSDSGGSEVKRCGRAKATCTDTQ